MRDSIDYAALALTVQIGEVGAPYPRPGAAWAYLTPQGVWLQIPPGDGVAEAAVLGELIPLWHAIQSSLRAIVDPAGIATVSPASRAAQQALAGALEGALRRAPQTWGDYQEDTGYEERLALVRLGLATLADTDCESRAAARTAFVTALRAYVDTCGPADPDCPAGCQLWPFLTLWAYWAVLWQNAPGGLWGTDPTAIFEPEPPLSPAEEAAIIAGLGKDWH